MARSRPPEGGWLSLARNISPFLALFLFFLLCAGAAAVVLGWVEVHGPQVPPPPAAAAPPHAAPVSSPNKARPAGPSVERAQELEDAFLALASRALVFRYQGGSVRCWVETSTGEKNQLVPGEVHAERGADSGVIVWLQQRGRDATPEPNGTFMIPQWWDLGLRAKAKGWESQSRLTNQKFEYPAPKPEDVKDAPDSGGGSVGTDSAIEGVLELKAGEPVLLYCRSMTARLRGGVYDGKEVTQTFSLLCELLAPEDKGAGNK